MSTPEDPRYRLAFDTAFSAVRQQEATVDELRGRTNTFLGTSFVAETLLIALGDLKKTPVGYFVAAGIVLVVAVGLLVNVLTANKVFCFGFGGYDLIDKLNQSIVDGDEIDINEMLRLETKDVEESYTSNGTLIKSMQARFNAGLVLTCLQLLYLGIIDVWTRFL
jgi:hypothetical protein